MSTIITRNSATSGSVPSSLVQGELAINVKDGRLFYGSGSGNVVKEFITSGSGGTIDTGSFVTTSSFNAYTGSNTSQFAGTASFATTASYYGGSVLSASYAQTASYAPAYLPLTGGTIDGNVTINGTASIAFLNVTYESASVIYSSGSNQFGDASNDVQTLWGTVDIKSGPVLVTGSVIATSGFTGSLLGTASYATQALSASYAQTASYVQNAQTASYVLSASYALTASYVENAQTASYVILAQTASYVQTAQTASYVLQAVSASFATLAQTANTASYVVTAQTASYVLQAVSASFATTASYAIQALSASYAPFIATNTGSLLVTASILNADITFTKGDNTTFGITVNNVASASYASTASYVLNAISASYVQNAQTASYVLQAVSASYATTASYSNTSTSASYAITASYALNALSASYATNGGVTQIIAGPNITVSPTTGVGQVTISSTGGGGGTGNTATGSYGSFYSTQTQTNVASTARSMSLNTTDITNGVSISGSTNPYNTYIKTENAGVYNIQFSAQVDKSDVGADEIWIWLRKNGTNLTETATSIKLTGNADHQVAAWNFFVNAAANDYFQLMWYSPDANVRLHAEAGFGVVPGIPSLIVTANRVDQFLSNTGSFSGSFTGNLIGTASYATQAVSASYATTASYSNTSTSASFATTATTAATASYVVLAQTASYVQTAQTASYVLQAVSASYATTASFATQALSASFSSTASYTPNAIVTASVSSNTITFTKGNGTTFPITVNTGSGGGGAVFPYTGSAIISGSLEITGSLFIQDINGIINIDSLNRNLYDTNSSSSIDWSARRLYDINGNRSVAWQNKQLGNVSGVAVSWDYPNLTQATQFESYTRNNIDLSNVGENFANFPSYAAFLPQGEILKNGITFDAAVVDFDLVYLETDNIWYPVNMTTASSTKMLGIAFGIANFDNQVLIEGTMVVNSVAGSDTPKVDLVDHGLPIYIKTGGGTYMSTTAPGSSGDNIRVLGHAYYNSTNATDYWIMKFRPSNSWVTI